jgi:hypothetical protein
VRKKHSFAVADRVQWFERRSSVMVDHADVPAAQGLQLALDMVCTVQGRRRALFTRDRKSCARNQARFDWLAHGLAGTGLAHQGEGLVLPYREVYGVDELACGAARFESERRPQPGPGLAGVMRPPGIRRRRPASTMNTSRLRVSAITAMAEKRAREHAGSLALARRSPRVGDRRAAEGLGNQRGEGP